MSQLPQEQLRTSGSASRPDVLFLFDVDPTHNLGCSVSGSNVVSERALTGTQLPDNLMQAS